MGLNVLILLICVFLAANSQNVGNSRIVGGHLVSIDEFPFLVSLQLSKSHICGGSILSEKFILTAAHCIELFLPTTIKVGVSDIREEGTLFKVKQGFSHPNYDKKKVINDVAVLELEEPLTFIPGKVMPVKLPEYSSNVPLKPALVAGWGYTNNKEENRKELRACELQVYPQEECLKYNELKDMTEAVFCAGHPSGKKDSCNGDSGGPLIIDGVIYGLVSYGTPKCASGVPGAYTNIPLLVNWVKEVANLS